MSEAVQEALRGWGIPGDLIVIILSALPVSELRGGIPAGFVLDLPVWRTFVLAVVANVLSVVPILLWAEWAASKLGRWPPLGRFSDVRSEVRVSRCTPWALGSLKVPHTCGGLSGAQRSPYTCLLSR